MADTWIIDGAPDDDSVVQITVTGVDTTDALAKLWLTAKANPADADAQALAQVTVTTAPAPEGQITANGGAGTGDGTATATVVLTPVQSKAIGETLAFYDVQVLSVAGVKRTPTSGRLRLRYQNITQADV